MYGKSKNFLARGASLATFLSLLFSVLLHRLDRLTESFTLNGEGERSYFACFDTDLSFLQPVLFLLLEDAECRGALLFGVFSSIFLCLLNPEQGVCVISKSRSGIIGPFFSRSKSNPLYVLIEFRK